MAARRGVALTDEHRRRVAAGEASIANIADELAVSRQTIWEGFRRRGWSTTVVAENKSEDSLGVDGDELDDGGRLGGVGAARSPVTRRSAPASPLPLPPSPSSASAAPSAPPMAVFEPPSHADLRTALREEVTNIAILALATARDLMAKPIGAAGLKSAITSIGLALDALDRVGCGVTDNPDEIVPVMKIMEYTAAEVEAIQAQAEREHKGHLAD